MKKSLLSIFALASLTNVAQESNFLNRGFENWSSTTYNYPDTLQSTTQEYLDYASQLDTIVVEKSNDAFEGDYSLKLSSKVTEYGDTANGYALLGSWGDNGPDGGASYTFQADSFSLMYKANLEPNDTAWIIFQLKKNGSLIGGGQYPISESANSWTELTAANPAGLALAPDTIFFAAIATNALEDEANSKPGSWIQIDRVGMKKMNGDFEAIDNGGFESWLDTTIYSATDWYSINGSRSSDAHSGAYALELSTYSDFDGDGDLDTNSGHLANYDLNNYNDYEGTHYIQQPLAFSAWVNYSPANGDTAKINVQFYQNDSWVAGESHNISVNTGGYSEIELPLSFIQAPDTVRLYATSGDNPGSVLLIDDVDLKFTITSSEELQLSENNIYPNPVASIAYFKSDGNYFKIHNILGAEVGTGIILNSRTKFDVSNFDKGMYFITAFNDSNENLGTKQFVVK